MTDDVSLRPLTDDEVFDALEAPFHPDEVKERAGTGGRRLYYIEEPTAKRRLDFVLGRSSWECDVVPSEGGVKCSLTIRLPSGTTLTRSALGGYCKMDSAEDSFKSGDTDSFKRACKRFGIAAYLYEEGPAAPAPPREHRKERGVWGGARPAAQPEGDRGAARAGGQPRTGRALFARLNEVERNNAAYSGLFDHVMRWGRDQGFPGKMTAWDFNQVKEAEGEAHRFCAGTHAEASTH